MSLIPRWPSHALQLLHSPQTREPSRHLGSSRCRRGQAHAATKNNRNKVRQAILISPSCTTSGEKHVREIPVTSSQQNGKKNENPSYQFFNRLTKRFFPYKFKTEAENFSIRNFPNLGDTYSQKLCCGVLYVRFTIMHDPKSNCLNKKEKQPKIFRKKQVARLPHP